MSSRAANISTSMEGVKQWSQRKIKRPFFAIGNKEEPKIVNEFTQFYFKQLGI